jgi:hypothetical protein
MARGMAELPDAPESVRVELRCPAQVRKPDGHCFPGKLFAMLVVSGQEPSYVHPDNLIELPCHDCKKARGVKRVLHRYDFAGNLVDTLVEE